MFNFIYCCWCSGTTIIICWFYVLLYGFNTAVGGCLGSSGAWVWGGLIISTRGISCSTKFCNSSTASSRLSSVVIKLHSIKYIFLY